jgi:hypothetical protein
MAFWKRRTVLLVIVGALVIASFTLSVHLAQSAPVANFYWPTPRFWELGAGCLLALLMEPRTHPETAASSNQRRFLELGCNILPVAGLGLIVASIVELNAATPFPGWPALLPVIGSLLILATPENAWLHRHVLGSPPLVWTGLISYGLYLWHWPLLSFLNILEAGSPPLTNRWVALGLSFLLAWLTYRHVELPARRQNGLSFNLRLLASAAAAGVAGLIIYAAGGFAQRFDEDVRALHQGPRRDSLCAARLGATEPINYCRTTSARPPSILFLGDSKAHAIYEVAAHLLAPTHSVMLLGRGGCPPMLNVQATGYDLNEQECEQVWQTFVRYTHQTKPKVVVIVGNGSFLITNRNVRLLRHGASITESKEATFEYGVRSLLDELTKFSRVIYLREIPGFATSPSCFLRAFRLPTTQCYPERDRTEVELAMAPYNRVLSRIQASFPAVQLIDSISVLCASGVCSQWPPGRPLLYSDDIHLSTAGARLLVEQTGLTDLISQELLSADSG